MALAIVAVVVITVTAGDGSTKDRNATGTLSPSVSDSATTGTVYTSKAGHFRARFPEQPDERSIPSTVGGIHINVQVAVAQDPVTEVAAETASTPVPQNQWDETMRVALTTFAAPANLTVNSQTATTFRGRPGRVAEYSSADGEQISALVFMYSGSRLYYLVAETGAPFTELQASFVALP